MKLEVYVTHGGEVAHLLQPYVPWPMCELVGLPTADWPDETEEWTDRRLPICLSCVGAIVRATDDWQHVIGRARYLNLAGEDT